MDYSTSIWYVNMKFLVLDNGLYVCHAEGLSDGGKNEVLYFTPYAKPFPDITDKMKGSGYGNLKKELGFWNHVKDADGIFNFDITSNDTIEFLRELYPDKSIFGAGKGEKLEHDRVFLKKWLEHYKLPVGPYVVIKGVTKLINYLKNNPNKYVKNNIWREDSESLLIESYEKDGHLIDERAATLGIFKETELFIVEDPIKAACQSGVDMFFNDDHVPFSWGFEISKNLCVNKVIHDIDELPECLSNNIVPLGGLMKRMGYRGAYSTEDRIISKDEACLIDFTGRVPAPMGLMYPKLINNWSDLCYKIGRGESVEVECDHNYIGSFALSSEHALTHNVKLHIDKDHLGDVQPQMCGQDEEGLWAIKGNSVVCCLIAGGKSPDEVIDKLKKSSEYVNAFSLDKEPIDGIDKQFEKALGGLTSVGIKF